MAVFFRGHPMFASAAMLMLAVGAASPANTAQADPVPRPRTAPFPEAGPPPAATLEFPSTGPVARQDLLLPPGHAAGAAPAGMTPEIARALRENGPRIEAPSTTALYAPLHAAAGHDAVEVRRDQAYGPHERHRADIFLPKARGNALPVLLFVHGGGFARGAKSAPGQFYYDNIGYWAAANGMVGVTINYRLAPEFPYPAGAEDVARAVSWLREQARSVGGDTARLFLFGHSAGGAHVADYLVRTPRAPVAGAILLSGIFNLGNEKSMWSAYYGEDVSLYPARSSLQRLIQVPTPLMAVWAELDPPDFVPDTEQLIAGRRAAGRAVTPLRLMNHSHLSEAYAIGTQDVSLTAPLLQFVRSTAPLASAN